MLKKVIFIICYYINLFYNVIKTLNSKDYYKIKRFWGEKFSFLNQQITEDADIVEH